MVFFLHLTKNRRTWGKIGPYENKADAQKDATFLTRGDVKATVKQGPIRVPVRANNPAAAMAIQTLLPLVLPLVTQQAKAKVQAYLKASPEQQVEMLRGYARLNLAVRVLLADEQRAAAVAAIIADRLKTHGDAAIDAAASFAAVRSPVGVSSAALVPASTPQVPPRTNTATGKKKKATVRAGRHKTKVRY